MLESLSYGQRKVLAVSTMLAPALGLLYVAAESDGAFVRAAKRGGILGLVGACGTSAMSYEAAKYEREKLDNAVTGSLVGGVLGLAAGVLGSLGYDSLRIVSD